MLSLIHFRNKQCLSVLCCVVAFMITVEATPLNNTELRSKVYECRKVSWNASSDACKDIPCLDTSEVTDMSYLFGNVRDPAIGCIETNCAETFNIYISRWNTASVTTMKKMFDEASSFNGDLSTWDVSRVENMDWMFSRTLSFNGDLSSWRVDNVKSMWGMFSGTRSFGTDISAWNTSAVTNMASMFSQSTFNGDISGWDTARVTNMRGIFAYNREFNIDLCDWDLGNLQVETSAFWDNPKLSFCDVNECESADVHLCDTNAMCSNTDGSFECSCNQGLQEISCQELCPTYDFADSMFIGGAQETILNDCRLCLSKNAIELGGPTTDQYLSLGTTEIGGSYTITVWAYQNSFNRHARIMDFFNNFWGGDNILLSAGEASDTTARHMHHSVRDGRSEVLHVYSTQQLPLQTWTHVAVVVDSSTCKMYYNGEKVAEVTLSTEVKTIERVHSYIGKDGWDGGQKWHGRIADFRVYNRPLTETEVRNVHLGTYTYATDVHALAGMQCSDQCSTFATTCV